MFSWKPPITKFIIKRSASILYRTAILGRNQPIARQTRYCMKQLVFDNYALEFITPRLSMPLPCSSSLECDPRMSLMLWLDFRKENVSFGLSTQLEGESSLVIWDIDEVSASARKLGVSCWTHYTSWRITWYTSGAGMTMHDRDDVSSAATYGFDNSVGLW